MIYFSSFFFNSKMEFLKTNKKILLHPTLSSVRPIMVKAHKKYPRKQNLLSKALKKIQKTF